MLQKREDTGVKINRLLVAEIQRSFWKLLTAVLYQASDKSVW